MMSTTIKHQNKQLSMLVIGKHIYAKRRDGYFHPGFIENKHDRDVYMVKFADGAKELVLEDNLTWLGFCGLPERYWPVRPRIQVQSDLKGSEFDNGLRHEFMDEDLKDLKAQRPASFTLLKNNDSDRKSSIPNSRPLLETSFGEQSHCAYQRVVVQPTITKSQNPKDETPQRSSVLRLNRKALSKEISTNNLASLSFRKRATHTDLLPTLSNQATEEYTKNKRSKFMETNIIRSMYPRKADNQFYERFNCERLEKPLCQRHCNSEDKREVEQSIKVKPDVENTYLRRYSDAPYKSLDWYETPRINQSAPTPPMTLLITPELSHLAHEIEFSHETEYTMKTIYLGGGRKRRDEMKKCRKVYGIINRHLWCTQCKWKKACSRFKA